MILFLWGLNKVLFEGHRFPATNPRRKEEKHCPQSLEKKLVWGERYRKANVFNNLGTYNSKTWDGQRRKLVKRGWTIIGNKGCPDVRHGGHGYCYINIKEKRKVITKGIALKGENARQTYGMRRKKVSGQ